MTTPQDLYNELAFYTLAHRDAAFIHQHVVDAFAVQHASESTKAIAVVFGLAGLYLHVEKGFTGRQVQVAHMRMAANRKQWPQISLPEKRGEVTIEHVLGASPGADRDAAIESWCASVWKACQDSRVVIADLLKRDLDIE